MTRFRIALALTVAGLTLSGCGLRPLYAGGNSGPVASALSGIEIAPIEGKAGWLVGNAVRDRLSAMGGGAALYRLDVVLDDQIAGLAVNRNDTVTRERRTLRARFKLIDASNQAVLLDATAGSDAGIDVVTSEYAVIAAEQTALENLSNEVADQIVSRVAIYARQHPPAK